MEDKRLKKWGVSKAFQSWVKGEKIEALPKGEKKWRIEDNPKWLLSWDYRTYEEPKTYVNIYHHANKVLACIDPTTLKDAKDRVTDHYLYTIHYTDDGVELLNLKQ